MPSPSANLPSVTNLPAAIESWVLVQEVPFRLEDVLSAVGDGGLDPIELQRLLAAHPSVARIGAKHHTPRTLAKRCSFVVRLLFDEREDRFLVPGGRFFPFCSLYGPPDDLKLRLPSGKVVIAEKTIVHPMIYEQACALLDPMYQDTSEDDLRCHTRRAYPLSGFCRRGGLPRELEVRCLEFEEGLYSVASHTPVSPEVWGRAKTVFRSELIAILESPPPGPVYAARQILHTVAAAVEKGWSLPVGPIGPLLLPDDRVGLDVVDGRTAFVLVGARPTRAAGSGDLAELLKAHLQNAERGIKRGREARGNVHLYTWDATSLRLSAEVLVGESWPYTATLDLSNLTDRIGFTCYCQQFQDKKLCRHGIALLRNLIAHLGIPGSEIGERVRADLSRPAWLRALVSLEPHLRAAARPSAPAEVHRVVWRLKAIGSNLHVEPSVQKLQATGGWTRGRSIRPDQLSDGEEPCATEADVCAANAIVSANRGRRRDPDDAFGVLRHLVGHPFVFWEDDLHRPVRIDRAELRLRFDARENGDLVPVFSAGGIDLHLGGAAYRGSDGFVLADRGAGRMVLASTTHPVQEIAEILLRGRVVFPPEAREELMARLPAFEAALPVDLPPDLAGEEVPSDARMRLRLTPESPSGLLVSIRCRPLVGGPLVAPGAPPERLSGVSEGKRVCVRRRLDDEEECARGIAAGLGLCERPMVAPWTYRIESDDDALDLIAALQDENWKDLLVEWDNNAHRMRLTREAVPKDLRVAVRDAQDWFGIEGALEIDGVSVPLAQVIQALREGRRYVPVGPGTWVRISKFFQDRLREMADLLHLDHGRLRIGPEAAPLLREAVRETGLAEACAAWDRFLERFDRAMAIEPNPPEGFTAELRPYQLEGYRWLSRLAAWGVGGILADDMGLGKTVQALALLLDRAKEGPALVIAPTSVSSNWIAETRRFAPKLHPVLYRETDRAAELDEIKGGDLVVVSYAMALRDVERLSKVKWGTLVLDEAQVVKNSQTKTAQAIRRIVAGWRVALTGTPIENHLGDLWSLFRAISPGLFGSWERFRERFAAPIERDHDPSRREALARLVRPFVLRRTKDQVLQDLPARTEIRLDAELSPEERKLYEQGRLAALAQLAQGGGDDQRFQILAALTRLRQLACHPRLVLPDAKVGSAKIEVFLETVDELREGGHRALVFSQFTSLLALVREALDARGVKYQYLDGSTPAAKRDEAIAAFQGGEGDLFLISLKAGGTGLNLTAADYVIHLDPWWNPAVEDQATNRAHRIGQTRPVTVYRIVATGTIEEKILSLHASKRDLVEGVLDGADQAGKLSTEELLSLIREA